MPTRGCVRSHAHDLTHRCTRCTPERTHTHTGAHADTCAHTGSHTHRSGGVPGSFSGHVRSRSVTSGGGGVLRWDAEAPPWEDRAKVINKSTRSKYIRVAASRGLPARNPQEVVSVKNDARHHSGSKRGARRGRARLISQRPRVPSACLRCRKGTHALAARPPFRSGRRGAPLGATWRGRGRGAGSGGPR